MSQFFPHDNNIEQMDMVNVTAGKNCVKNMVYYENQTLKIHNFVVYSYYNTNTAVLHDG